MSHSPTYKRLIQVFTKSQLRRDFVRDHPICELCKQEGFYTPTQCVHHIIDCESVRSEEAMKQLMFDEKNLQALCFLHHRQVHTGNTKKHKQCTENTAKIFIDKFL